MQGKIFFSLNTFQISDLWFSNCEGEKWKRGRYWGRKLAYLVILHDVWPVPTNGWILLPPLMRFGGLPVPPAQPQLPAAAHPTASRTLTTLHRCAKFQRVMIPKAPFKIPRGDTERRTVTPETPTTGWWVTDAPCSPMVAHITTDGGVLQTPH